MSSRGSRYSVSSPASWRRVRLTTQRTRSTSPEAGKPASHAPPTRAPARRAGLSRRSLQLQRRHHALTPHTSNSATFLCAHPPTQRHMLTTPMLRPCVHRSTPNRYLRLVLHKRALVDIVIVDGVESTHSNEASPEEDVPLHFRRCSGL